MKKAKLLKRKSAEVTVTYAELKKTDKKKKKKSMLGKKSQVEEQLEQSLAVNRKLSSLVVAMQKRFASVLKPESLPVLRPLKQPANLVQLAERIHNMNLMGDNVSQYLEDMIERCEL